MDRQTIVARPVGAAIVKAIYVAALLLITGCAPDPSMIPIKTILFLGDSLTHGYTLPQRHAYPGVIEEKIKEEGLPFRVVNAGISGHTTMDGLARLDGLLTEKVDVFVLALGINDGFRQVSGADIRRNLQEIIDRVKAKNPNVKLVVVGMKLPAPFGGPAVREFNPIFKDVAEKNRAAFVPYLLEGVAGDPQLNLPDGIHPTADGQKILAENVWKVLKKELRG
jgi:acyl-CoA thioesterase I